MLRKLSLLCIAMFLMSCNFNRGQGSPTSSNTSTDTSQASAGSGGADTTTTTTNPTQQDGFTWTKILLPTSEDNNGGGFLAEAGGLYMSRDMNHLYVLTSESAPNLYYADLRAGRQWQKIAPNSLANPDKQAGTTMVELSQLLKKTPGREIVPTHSGLALTDSDKKLALIHGNIMEWAINTAADDNLIKVGDANGVPKNTAISVPIKLFDLRGLEYVAIALFSAVNFLHKTGDNFNEPYEKWGELIDIPEKNPLSKFRIRGDIDIDLHSGKEKFSDGAAVELTGLEYFESGYEAQDGSMYIHLVGKGIFHRVKN